MFKRVSSIFFGLFIFGIYTTVLAQTQDTILTISPEFPKPGEDVFINLDSYSVDLSSSVIKWSEGGIVKKSGVGVITYSTKAGNPGSSTVVDVEITAPNGQMFRDGIIFWPAEVNLLYESDGYVPPFYKGAAPYVWGGRLKFTAVPEMFKDGKRINPKELLYTWKKNGQTIKSVSGYGKNTFFVSEISYTRVNQDISVEVASPTENLVAQTGVSVRPESPNVVFYEDSPLYGIKFSTILGEQITIRGDEARLLAIPYFFSNDPNGDPKFLVTWTVDGTKVPEYDDNYLTLHKKKGVSGSSVVSVEIKNPRQSFQNDKRKIRVYTQNN